MNILQQLAEASKGKAKFTTRTETIRGKAICLYGRSDCGKTSVCSKLPNPIFLPLERGLAATSNVLTLPTASWADIESHLRLLKSKQWVEIVQSTEEPVCIIVDGAEKLVKYAERRVLSDAGVTEIAKAGAMGQGYKKMENLVVNFLMDLLNLDYTIIFICHEQVGEDGYINLKGDRKRNIDPIVENCDIVAWLEPRPLDEDGRPGLSKAHFFAGEYFFARSRFIEMDSCLDPFTADGLIRVIEEGIRRENEKDGVKGTSYEKRNEAYQSTFELTFEEALEKAYEMMDKLDELDKSDFVDEIIIKHLGEIDNFKNLKTSQFESLQGIYEELEELLNN
jgi:hypothetical protein